jgi:hypothetical protein
MRRPNGDGRCIHCRELLAEQTEDHVFPKGWYPDSTPQSVQRWTVPSCQRCNRESGEREQELLMLTGLCVDPRKFEAAGIAEKVKRSFGVGRSGLSEKERKIREARKNRILSSLSRYTEEQKSYLVPGLGPHAGFPVEKQFQIQIPSELIYEVAKKIVRGCEFWLANGRIIEPPYELSVYLVPKEEIPDVLNILERGGVTELGPGFKIRRAGATDDPLSAIYEVTIWDSWTLYYGILPPET